MNSKLPPNVIAFIDRASADVAKIEAENFGADMFCRCLENFESPIEQLFYVAFFALCRSIAEEPNPGPEFDANGKPTLAPGIYIRHQFPVDRYRVDFLITKTAPRAPELSVIVELDGHAFHDKDKRQRSYEKARDRHLLKRGYRVLHYTGSDVCADPYKVAHEALDMVEAFGPMGCEPYDKSNPVGAE